MQHGTCRGEKISAIRGSIGLVGRLTHNLREKDNLVNVDHSRTPDNEFLIGSSNIAGIIADTEARLKTVSTKIRGDSVKAIEFVITLTPDALEKNGGKMTPEKVDLYLSDGLEFAKKLYGAENVVSAIRHRDEGVDHLHVIAVPIQKIEKAVRRVISVDPETGKKTFELTGEKKSKTVLNCQNIFEDRLSLSQFQTKFYKEVSKKYGLERGVKSLDRTHERSNLDKALTARTENLEKKEQKFDKEYAKYLDERTDFDRKFLTLEKREKDLQEKEVITKAWEVEVAKRDKTVTERERSATALEKDLAVREKETVHQEDRARAFNKSKAERLRGWKLPEPKVLESAKKYRERVEPEVSGKIVRALEQIDSSKAEIKKAVDEAIAGKDTHLKMMSDTCYRIDREGKESKRQAESANQKYQDLRSGILKASSVDEINQIKNELSSKPNRGMER